MRPHQPLEEPPGNSLKNSRLTNIEELLKKCPTINDRQIKVDATYLT
jgi:hypothetical protein